MLSKRERPAPFREAGLVHPRELPAAKRTAPQHSSPDAPADQLIQTATDAIRDALAAVGGDPAALPPAARAALAGLLGAAVITRPAKRLTLDQAAHLAGRSPQTLGIWAVRHGLGHRVGGRWQIDAARLAAFIAGDAR